jgi:hypothetical protein
VERLTRARGERGSIRLPWLTDFGFPGFFTKNAPDWSRKIGSAKSTGRNQ